MLNKAFKKLCVASLAIMTLPLLAVARGDRPFVVVAIRQFQVIGPSNIHLYLYGLDGKLKKQLTDAPGLDDEQPALDYDSQTVIFTRTASDPRLKAKAGRYILDLESGDLHRLPPGLTHNDDESQHEPSVFLENLSWANDSDWALDPKSGPGATSIRSVDSAYDLISVPHPVADDPGGDSRAFLLRTPRNAKAVSIADFPGFMARDYLDYYESFLTSNNSPFILGPKFAAAFLSHHLGSTDGEEIWGLDLRARHWTRMSGNGGRIYHRPDDNGVFFIDDSRYEPWPGRQYHSINCSYLEWWDAHLKRSRLGPPLSDFYGAAIHFADGQNATINEMWGS